MANIIVRSSGVLEFNGKEYKCALGKGGVGEGKKEGDGKTPIAVMPMRRVFYRADLIPQLVTSLPTQILQLGDGWCDEPTDPNYNKYVKLPYAASHEKLWRDDVIYDIIVELGWNDDPQVPGKGSAIFMHVARPTYGPTAGCIALSKQDLLELIAAVSADTQVEVMA